MWLAVGASEQGATEGATDGEEHKPFVKWAFRRVCLHQIMILRVGGGHLEDNRPRSVENMYLQVLSVSWDVLPCAHGQDRRASSAL